MIFETHAHYDDEAFDVDRDKILKLCYEEKVYPVINAAVNGKTCEATLKLTREYPFVYGVLGFHPSDAADYNDEERDLLRQRCLSSDKILGIGEIGLDYHYDEPDREIQKEVFISQLKLARELSLPVVIHSRDAAKDTMDIIKEYGADLSGVIHCYSYHLKDALEYVKMGYYIGVGGVLTFKNAHKLREVVEGIPIERILLETDSPYLAPVPYRGKRNCSLYLTFVADALAEMKGISREEAERITFDNAVRLFGIKDIQI
ncbi:MAG: TatD family hydrolase [Lachnospiraceae bacterium]|nr:TatD family hydrolase [Lachnospiraceae bacterium]